MIFLEYFFLTKGRVCKTGCPNDRISLRTCVKLQSYHRYIKRKAVTEAKAKRPAAEEKMAKGDDALARKKNKSTRKKMNRKNDSATVSTRIASIIAAKKRRKSGKRSMCQVHSLLRFHF